MLPAKKYLFTILQTLLSLGVASQPQNAHWYFGDSAAIHFTDTGVVSSSDGSMYAREGCATISDSLGSLLFYTNGWRIWNRDHEIMANGDSLFVPDGLGSNPLDGYYNNVASSITQSTVIIPRPDRERQYYVLTNSKNSLYNTLYYSAVDQSQYGDLGAVPIGKKSLVVADSLMGIEKLHAVKHANGRDWWIIRPNVYTPTSMGSEVDSSYYYFLATPEGITFSHIQQIGYASPIMYAGETAVSKQGDKFAIIGNWSVQVFEFDRCSGELEKSLLLDTFPEFSSEY